MQKSFYLFLFVITISICYTESVTSGYVFALSDSDFKMPIRPKFYNEFARIGYRFSGCFGDDSYDIVLYKKDGTNYAAKEKDGDILMERQIAQPQIDKFEAFLQELKEIPSGGGCTTVEHYWTSYKNEIYSKTYGDCDWTGFERLNKALFFY